MSQSRLPHTLNRMGRISPSLYEEDETAWLEQTADLVAEQRWAELDSANLQEYLRDMARRDRHATYNRLIVLLRHLLKWEHQPEKALRLLAPRDLGATAQTESTARERHAAPVRDGIVAPSLP